MLDCSLVKPKRRRERGHIFGIDFAPCAIGRRDREGAFDDDRDVARPRGVTGPKFDLIADAELLNDEALEGIDLGHARNLERGQLVLAWARAVRHRPVMHSRLANQTGGVLGQGEWLETPAARRASGVPPAGVPARPARPDHEVSVSAGPRRGWRRKRPSRPTEASP